jgi:hypothetical protein
MTEFLCSLGRGRWRTGHTQCVSGRRIREVPGTSLLGGGMMMMLPTARKYVFFNEGMYRLLVFRAPR